MGSKYLAQCATINLAFRREVFHAIDGFDEGFAYGSDLDFSWRAFGTLAIASVEFLPLSSAMTGEHSAARCGVPYLTGVPPIRPPSLGLS